MKLTLNQKWWIGGLATAAIVVAAAYRMFTMPYLSDVQVTPPGATATGVVMPASAQNELEVGGPVPTKITSVNDLREAEAALAGDPDLSLSDIDQDIASLR